MLRIIFVACLTFALATPPAAGAITPVMMADASHGTQAHCLEHAGAAPADHGQEGHHDSIDRTEPGQARGHCVDHAACSGKCLCLTVTAVLAWIPEISTSRLPRPSTTRVAIRIGGPAYIPPSPPPRV